MKFFSVAYGGLASHFGYIRLHRSCQTSAMVPRAIGMGTAETGNGGSQLRHLRCASPLPSATSTVGSAVKNEVNYPARARTAPSANTTADTWSAALPDIPYGFPEGEKGATPYAAEQSGGLQKRWLQEISSKVTASHKGDAGSTANTVYVEHYLPNKDELWNSPPYEALREVVLRSPYHDALKIIMEHDYRFLFSDVMCNVEAPMPHVLYEDFMKCLTFSSLQQPPEDQFALSEDVLRDLLCWAAYYCTLDRFYFTSASLLFRKVEQEQQMSSAVHSAWIYICTAAAKWEDALAYAAYMDTHGIPFDAGVFALMLHPSLTPTQRLLHQAPHTSKGLVLQRRLCQDMNQNHGTLATAVHAMFVYHILTLQHTRKWDVLCSAAELFLEQQRNQMHTGWVKSGSLELATSPASASAEGPSGQVVSSRTVHLALFLFGKEKGVRWGPRTTKALVSLMIRDEEMGCTAADVLFVLLRVRRNEESAVLAALPKTVFTEEEQAVVMQAIHRRSRIDPSFAVAAPLMWELVTAGATDDKAKVAPAATNSHAHLQSSIADTNGSVDALKQVNGGGESIRRAMQQLRDLSAGASPYSSPSSLLPHPVSPGNNSHLSKSADTAPHNSESLNFLIEMNSSRNEAAGSWFPSPADVARDLLTSIMALDRQSVEAAATRLFQSSDALSTPTDAQRLQQRDDHARKERDAASEKHADALRTFLGVAGTGASQSFWSLEQLRREEEETRLQAQAATAWISPSFTGL